MAILTKKMTILSITRRIIELQRQIRAQTNRELEELLVETSDFLKKNIFLWFLGIFRSKWSFWPILHQNDYSDRKIPKNHKKYIFFQKSDVSTESSSTSRFVWAFNSVNSLIILGIKAMSVHASLIIGIHRFSP